MENKTIREIAKELGVYFTTVEESYQSALKKLKNFKKHPYKTLLFSIYSEGIFFLFKNFKLGQVVDNKKVYSYSLKKKKLKKWIYENNYTLPFVAKRLGISKDELKRKLSEHDGYNKHQIKSLIYLVGANNAIDIIYFPSLKIKEKIISEVFRKGGGMSK